MRNERLKRILNETPVGTKKFISAYAEYLKESILIINHTKERGIYIVPDIEGFNNLHKQPNRFEKYKVIKF